LIFQLKICPVVAGSIIAGETMATNKIKGHHPHPNQSQKRKGQ